MSNGLDEILSKLRLDQADFLVEHSKKTRQHQVAVIIANVLAILIARKTLITAIRLKSKVQ